jgi:hypothetical protein
VRSGDATRSSGDDRQRRFSYASGASGRGVVFNPADGVRRSPDVAAVDD